MHYLRLPLLFKSTVGMVKLVLIPLVVTGVTGMYSIFKVLLIHLMVVGKTIIILLMHLVDLAILLWVALTMVLD